MNSELVLAPTTPANEAPATRVLQVTQAGGLTFAADKASVLKTSATGAISLVHISKKEYGLKHKLKGRALDKAHEKYRMERGVAFNVEIAALQTAGKIVAERVGQNKKRTHMNVSYRLASEFDLGPSKEEVATALDLMSDGELDEVLEQHLAKKAAAKAAKVEASK